MANSKIYIPLASGIKAVPQNYHSVCGSLDPQLAPNVRTNDNTLLRDSIAANKDKNIAYQQGIEFQPEGGLPFLKCDTITIQLKSDFAPGNTHGISIYENCSYDTALSSYIFNLIKDNQNYTVQYDCEIYYQTGASYIYVYFTQGSIFDSSGTLIDKHYLNGSMPEFADQISEIDLTQSSFNFNNLPVDDIVYVSEINSFAFKCPAITGTGTNTTGRCEMTYKRDDFNVYQVSIDLSAYSDIDLRFRIIASDGTVTRYLWTEPILVRDYLPGYSKLEWYNENPAERWLADFTNFKPFIYINEKHWESVLDQIDDNQYQTDTGKTISVFEQFSEVYRLTTDMQIAWVARLIDLIFKCDHVFIRGKQYQKIEQIDSEIVEVSDRIKLELLIGAVKVNGVIDEEFDFAHQSEISKTYVDENDKDYVDETGTAYTDE